MKTPDYTKIIKTSFELVKKNKWLWIFGALVGSGGGASYDSLGDLFKNQGVENKPSPDVIKEIPQKTANVLGEATNVLTEWLQSVPTGKWILITLLILLLAIAGMFIWIIIHNWARGGLIKGIDEALNGKETDLGSISPKGFLHLTELIKLSLIIFGIMMTFFVVVPLFWAIIYLILKNISVLGVFWIILGILSGIVIFIASILITTLVNIYAERLIVLKDMKANESFMQGIIAARKTFLASILTGGINFGIKMGVGVVKVIIMGIFIGVPGYLTVKVFESNPAFSFILGAGTALSFMILMIAMSLINAGLNVFSYANWNQLFNLYLEIKETKNEQK